MQKKEPTTEQILSALNEMIQNSSINKVELKNKKTVDTWMVKVKAHRKEAEKLEALRRKAFEKTNELKAKRDNEIEKFRKVEKEVQEFRDKANEAGKIFQEQLKKDNEIAKESEANYQSGLGLFNQFSNAIDEFYAAGKELGVNIDTREYRKQLEELKIKPTL